MSTGIDARCHAYETVAAAIRWLRAHARGQPSLAEVAAAVGLSEFHLQRVFGEWAGISPKRFLQHLTREHAREALRRPVGVLDAALEAGLSGPGRLHDLCVACDGVSPGEVAALGEGLEIRHGFAPTPFGRVLVGVTARGVCHLRFTGGGGDAQALDDLRAEWPRAALVEDSARASAVIASMFPGDAPPRPLHLWLRGTNFQIKVWEALLRVPAGEVVSYGRLAQMAGVPGAARAVGNAVAANPVAVLIPCHRVIRESGDAGNYRWSPERKQALIAWESSADRQAL